MRKVEFKIGVGPAATDEIVTKIEAAIAAAERGETVAFSQTIRFETWDLFHRLMTPNRTKLVQYVAEHERVASIRALSIALGRDYAAVHSDVKTLTEAGLLGRDGKAITCDVEIGTASMVSV